MDAHKRYRCEDFIDNAEYFLRALRVSEKVQVAAVQAVPR